MNLVKINAADYGLEENKAKQISDMFKPMLDKMTELETEYNSVVKLDIDNETCEKAKELRLKYVKVRTGTALIHKELKAFYLQGGRFVDGWKNAQLMASQGIEEKLSNIENHFEQLKKERIVKLQEERVNELKKYTEDGQMMSAELGNMASDVWNNYITGVKLNYETQKEAERKAEEERVKKEKAEKLYYERLSKIAPYSDFDMIFELDINTTIEIFDKILLNLIEQKKSYDIEQENIRIENEKLKKEAEAKEIKRLADEKIRLEKEEKERKEREEKQRIEKEKQEAILRKEKEAKAKIEKELEAKKEAEKQTEIKRLADIETELNKGDTEKVKDLINDLSVLKTKYIFKSKKSNAMYQDISTLIDKVILHIKQN